MESQIAIWITPVLVVVGFVAQAAYFKGVFGTKISEHDRRLEHIESGVVWHDGCGPKHDEVNRRLDKLEKENDRENYPR